MKENKDFWERLDKLEELAGKATQGEWCIATSDGIDWGDLYITTEDRDKTDIQWIATVDDAIFRADETPTDFQKEQNANACYIAAANPAMIKEMIAEIRRLEKEADWLAEFIANLHFCTAEETDKHIYISESVKKWRNTARKAVEQQNERK